MWSHWMAAICAGGLLLGCQSHLEDGPDSEGRSRVVLPVTLMVGVAAALGIYTRLQAHRRPWGRPDLERAARLSYEYLRMRIHQFREDVARGAGPTVEELAGVVNVRREHVSLFGTLLWAHRGELLKLADARTLTPARSLELIQRVGTLVRSDPLLGRDLEAALVVYEAR